LAVGVKLTAPLVETEPVVGFVLTLPIVQLEGEKVPPLFAKLTVPVGAVATTGVASVTVAVQLVGLPTGTEAGVQLTLVAVECLVAVTAAGGLVESASAPSPASLPKSGGRLAGRVVQLTEQLCVS